MIESKFMIDENFNNYKSKQNIKNLINMSNGTIIDIIDSIIIT
jgi:hypothetical protein